MAGDDHEALARTLTEVAERIRRLAPPERGATTMTREVYLAIQVEGIAHQLTALRRERRDTEPGG